MRTILGLLISAFCLNAQAELKILIIDTGLSSNRTELTKFVHPLFKNSEHLYKDEHGHGTHVTSLVLKNACESVTIIPCNFFNPDKDSLAEEIRCLKLGLKHKVNMVNMSLNGRKYSKEEHKVLKQYEKLKIPVYVALGNEGKESKTKISSYPADLNLSNMVRIGSLDLKKLNFADTSNIRSNSIYLPHRHLGASKFKGLDKYMEGTSQATAYYTGLQVKKYCESRKK